MYLYLIFYVAILIINLCVAFITKEYEMDVCNRLCLLNVISYSLLYFCLTAETKFFKPVLKGWSYANYPQYGRRGYVIHECIKLMKYNIPWLLLTVFPYILVYFLNPYLFNDFSMIEALTVAGLFYLSSHIYVLSSIIRNFLIRWYGPYISLLGLITILLNWRMPERNTDFLIFIVIFILLTFLAGAILIPVIKRKKTAKSV